MPELDIAVRESVGEDNNVEAEDVVEEENDVEEECNEVDQEMVSSQDMEHSVVVVARRQL